ncbi:MAG: hypothetical protein IJG63_03325 [Oscillospiraceae bacterium]|nr:hypothetical protein [Oscillospiraceae bacterium]
MIKLGEKEKEFLFRNLERADDLILSENVNDVLLPLDEWIAMNGFDEDYNLTDEGRTAQRIYDRIYENNVPEKEINYQTL